MNVNAWHSEGNSPGVTVPLEDEGKNTSDSFAWRQMDVNQDVTITCPRRPEQLGALRPAAVD